MICIQRKDSAIAGHALSKLKVAFFFRYNDSSFAFECYVIFTYSSIQ